MGFEPTTVRDFVKDKSALASRLENLAIFYDTTQKKDCCKISMLQIWCFILVNVSSVVLNTDFQIVLIKKKNLKVTPYSELARAVWVLKWHGLAQFSNWCVNFHYDGARNKAF